MKPNEANKKKKLSPGDGYVRVEANGSGRATLSDLAFSYPLKLMPPRIAASDASLAPGLLSLYMLTYGGYIRLLFWDPEDWLAF